MHLRLFRALPTPRPCGTGTSCSSRVRSRSRPGHDQLVGETIEEQTEQACENLKAILEAAGSSFDKVLNTTIYLTDFGDFPKLNEVYGRYVGDTPPARATVQIAALPMGARVEIAVVAHV